MPVLRYERLLIALFCYVASYSGYALTLLGAYGLARSQSLLVNLLPGVWVFAWLAHAVMCVAWVQDKRTRPFWVRAGTLAGCLSLASPAVAAWLNYRNFPAADWLDALLGVYGLLLATLAPNLLLALWLARYHWPARRASPRL